MTVYKKDTVIESYTACDIVTRAAQNTRNGPVINITYNDQLYSGKRAYTVGTVTGYALEYNECPIEAHKREKDLGGSCYWINQNAISITATPRAKKKLLKVDFDAVYFLEGKRFKIVKTDNDNLALREVIE